MQLTKHHGLANDFLVLIDLDQTSPITADLARALCHRSTGIGADGLIRVTPGTNGADLTMELLNSDGSPAEMSGNGMRCLVQAVVMAKVAPGSEFAVATAGGVRAVSHRLGSRPGESWVSVDMGPTSHGAVDPASLTYSTPYTHVASVDIGNPHLVMLVDDPATIDLAQAGPAYESQFAHGANIHWIAVDGADALRLRVWERGAGITQACGTGACAAATAAHSWGLVGSDVRVTMPGGAVEVGLGDTVTLSGPAAFIATIDVDPDWLVV
jgi:diaminopimelate epimerase